MHCPDVGECYCRTFGLCGLRCEEGKCGDGMWPFPPSSTLPKGWPVVGWNGEIRDEEKLREIRRIAMGGNETLT